MYDIFKTKMKFKMKLSTIFLFKIFLVLIIKTESQNNNNSERIFTRIIMTSQGALQGTIIVPIKKHGFPRIERFLGIPYAKPPVKNLRFMPPGSPPPWKDHGKICDSFGPVCPQILPTLDKKSMSEARYKHLKQLLPYLERQSEDCLYLNIYAPENEHGVPQKNPVIVYIHGESFEWNSGNPYDGSILASYGKVVVVTLNFRLGILGFMKPGIKDTTPANFGLLDQIAALQWIQDNIAAFGGNPESVTLMGHGTGAACVNFLMVSPVARGAGQGLFHRAILMSGTALADWALTANFRQITTQVAAALNCPPTEDDNEMADCLKAKRLEDILNTQVVTPNFTTPFGPVIDGSVVPNKPSETMGVYTDLFSRYDLLCGVTELESYHLLNAVSLAFGMTEKDRDEMLRAYIAPRFEIFPDLVLTKTLDEYTDYTYQDHFRTSGYKHRDVILDILSDARVVAPLIQTASFHSAAVSKTYFYVFKHNSIFSSFANVEKSVHGEEILFVFGIPLLGSKHPYSEPVNQEAMFAEAVMTYWTNFAKTGNPNYPRKVGNRQFDLTWPPYEKSKMHMNLSIPLALSKDYRQEYMKFWNEVLPAEMDDYLKNSIFNKPSKPKQPPLWLYPNVGTSTSWMNPPISYPKTGTSYNHDNIVGGVFHSTYPKQKYKVVDTTTPVYGTIKNKPPISDGPKRPPYIPLDNLDNNSPTVQPESLSASFGIVIALGIVFLLINIVVFAALYYKRDRLKAKERTLKRKYEDNPLDDNNTDEKDDKRQKVEDGLDEKGCNVMKMMKSSRSDDVYEAVKLNEKSISQCSPKSSPKYKFTRKMSTSTIDPHTKVREWIAHEIVQRCSPRFLRKTRQQKENEENKNGNPTKGTNKANREPELRNQISVRPTSPIYSGNDSGNQSMQSESSIPTKQTGIPVNKTGTLKKPKKVSVAIDATSDARSSSVLKQEPIELTKSLDYPKLKPFNTLPIRRSATLNDFLDNSQNNLRRSTTNINLQPMLISNTSEPSQSTVIKIDHSHSKSDPVQATYVKNPDGLYIYSSNQIPLKLQTFNGPDINVTCRDDSDANIKELTPEEALQTIKRRKFPKVLPDFPENEAGSSYAQKRRSLPPPSNLSFMPVVNEGLSPNQNLPNNQKIYSRIPPAPPPRISSTLGRKPVNADPIVPIMQQSSSEEPTIVCNSIHVGSLIPQKESGTRRPVNMLQNDHKEPIYVSSKGHQQAKTIISASSSQPIRRNEPKVVIKPSIGKKCDITVTTKSIPRVMASETDPTKMNHGLFAKQNSQNEQGSLFRQNSQNDQKSLSRQNSQNEQRPLSRQNSQNEQRPLSRQNSQNEQRPLSRQNSQNEQRSILSQNSQNEQRPLSRQNSQNEQRPLSRQNSQNDQRPILRQNSQNEQRPILRQNSQNEQRPILRQNSQNEQRPILRQNSQNEQRPLSRQNSQNEQLLFCRQNCEKTVTQNVQGTIGSGELPQKPDQKSKVQKISFIPTLLKTAASNKSSSNSSNSTSDGSNSDTGTVKRIIK